MLKTKKHHAKKKKTCVTAGWPVQTSTSAKKKKKIFIVLLKNYTSSIEISKELFVNMNKYIRKYRSQTFTLKKRKRKSQCTWRPWTSSASRREAITSISISTTLLGSPRGNQLPSSQPWSLWGVSGIGPIILRVPFSGVPVGHQGGPRRLRPHSRYTETNKQHI